MIVFLLGFRGAGKSTLGKEIQGWEQWEYFDLDERIEARIGMPILQLVEQEGLARFRLEETKELRSMLQNLPKNGRHLIGLGGGILEGDEAFELLKNTPIPKVLLEVPEQELWLRLEPHPDRRKIANLQTFSDLQKLFQKRAPRFKEIATHPIQNRDITLGLRELKKTLGSVWQAAL